MGRLISFFEASAAFIFTFAAPYPVLTLHTTQEE